MARRKKQKSQARLAKLTRELVDVSPEEATRIEAQLIYEQRRSRQRAKRRHGNQ
jgi:hypothetical protein